MKRGHGNANAKTIQTVGKTGRVVTRNHATAKDEIRIKCREMMLRSTAQIGMRWESGHATIKKPRLVTLWKFKTW